MLEKPEKIVSELSQKRMKIIIKESKSCTSEAWKRIVQLHYENLTLYWVSATEKKDVRLTNQKGKKNC